MSAAATSRFAALHAAIDRVCSLTATYDVTGVTAREIEQDLVLIQSQAGRARATIAALEGATEGRTAEELHRLNNALTGVITLAVLSAEDVPHAPTLLRQLRETEHAARAAAQLIRDLGAGHDVGSRD